MARLTGSRKLNWLHTILRNVTNCKILQDLISQVSMAQKTGICVFCIVAYVYAILNFANNISIL